MLCLDYEKILYISILVLLLITCGILSWVLFHKSKIVNHLYLPSLTYNDYGDVLLADGTWNSDTQMVNQLQTSKIKCYKKFTACVESTADTALGVLSVESVVYDVEKWTESEISLKPNETASCTKYVMHIDRISKIITKIRTTIKTDGLCENMDTTPIYLQLDDGFKVWQKINK
ncbi:MAG: hypothetical protein R3B41_01200 [Candidatus Doudnabacteria bacterium]